MHDRTKMEGEMLTVSVTGHRPHYFKDPVQERIAFRLNFHSFIRDRIPHRLRHKDGKGGHERIEGLIALCGGAQGVDTWAAEFCYEYGIPFHLYVPFEFDVHTKSWDEAAKLALRNCMDKCSKYVVVHQGQYYPAGYQKRNVALVDNSDTLVTYMEKMASGSGNCLKYAQRVGKEIIHLRGVPC